jgi:uncharacterized protein (TIGR02145 family)
LHQAYGGVSSDATDTGAAAYGALLGNDAVGFRARLGGNRSPTGQYERLDAHGLYWTATESEQGRAWFYNFARGGLALHRQDGGEPSMALSARCIAD